MRALNLALVAAASLGIKAVQHGHTHSWSARLRSIHKEDAAEDSGCHLFAKHGLGQSNAEVLVGEIEHDDHRVTHKTRASGSKNDCESISQFILLEIACGAPICTARRIIEETLRETCRTRSP